MARESGRHSYERHNDGNGTVSRTSGAGTGVDITRLPGELASLAWAPVGAAQGLAAQLSSDPAAVGNAIALNNAVEEGLASDPRDVLAVAGGAALIATGNVGVGVGLVSGGIGGLGAAVAGAYSVITAQNAGAAPGLGPAASPVLTGGGRPHWSVYFLHPTAETPSQPPAPASSVAPRVVPKPPSAQQAARRRTVPSGI